MAIIYAIICVPNGMAYVGCTKGKPAKRMREHRCLLNKGIHSSSVAQMGDDWKRYGAEAFQQTTLEDLGDATIAVKREAELRWMRRYADDGRLYNRHMISFDSIPGSLRKAIEASRGVCGQRWTPEANLKRSIAQRGKPKGHGAKISATKRAKRLQQLAMR